MSRTTKTSLPVETVMRLANEYHVTYFECIVECSPDLFIEDRLDIGLEDRRDIEVDVTLSTSIRADYVHAVVDYIMNGNISRELSGGLCTEEIRFIGAEKLFQERREEYLERREEYLAPCMDEFAMNIRWLSTGMWVDFMGDLYDRQVTFMDPVRAAAAVLQPFNQASVRSTGIVDFDLSRNGIIGTVHDASAFVDGLSFDNLVAFEEVLVKREMAGVPWLKSGDVGVVMCGGALESLIQQRRPRDLDIFLVCKEGLAGDALAAVGRRLIAQTIDAVVAANSLDKIYMHVKPHVVDIVIQTRRDVLRPATWRTTKIQIITRIYASMAQVVAGFDIDSCRLAFDGSANWAHPTALRAWRNGWNLFDAMTLSTTATLRYTKKCTAGLGILIPGVSQKEIDDLTGVCSLAVQAPATETLWYECYSYSLKKPPSVHTLIMSVVAAAAGKGAPDAPSDYEVVLAPSAHLTSGFQARFPGDDELAREYPQVLQHTTPHKVPIEVDTVYNVRHIAGVTLFSGAFNPIVTDIYKVNHKLVDLVNLVNKT